MDTFNAERKKVTIVDPYDKLSQDIQLKTEKVLSDLRSVPLKYTPKKNKALRSRSLENVLLQEKLEEDCASEDCVGRGSSDVLAEDSDEELSELSDKKFAQIISKLNKINEKRFRSPEKHLDVYKHYEEIYQKTDLLKIRCEMLQTYLDFLETRKQSLEKVITELQQEYRRSQQIQGGVNENQCKLDCQQFEEILTNQSIALAREKEQSTKIRLKYESAEAARFALSQQLQLTCSEYNADKAFYLRQIKQLEQEIEERIHKSNEVKTNNEQLQKEAMDFKRQISLLKDELKEKEFEINVINQCYDQKWKELNEKHSLDIVRLQKEITDLSVEKSNMSAKYECEISSISSQLRMAQDKVHDLLCEKESLCKQLQEINHKLNISSQEKDELQKRSEAELLKIKQEKEAEFSKIQTNLQENHKSKLNEMQAQFDKDLELVKKNHETEIEKLKTDLKDIQSLNKQLTCYIDTLENCIQNTQRQKLSNQQVQTDIHFIPTEVSTSNKHLDGKKNVSTQRSPSLDYSADGGNKMLKLKDLTSANNKSTGTSTGPLDIIPSNTSSQCLKEKEHKKAIENYENKLSQLQVNMHQLGHDYDSLIHLFNNTVNGIIKFGNRECGRFSKLLNIHNKDVEVPSVRSRTPYQMKLMYENEGIANSSENNLVVKSWIDPMIEVIGKLSAYCIRICDLIESQQEHLEWQSENLTELRDITRKQIEVQKKQIIKTRKAQLNRMRNSLQQKQTATPPLVELPGNGCSKTPELCSLPFNTIMNKRSAENLLSQFPSVGIRKPLHENICTVRSPIFPSRKLVSDFYSGDINKTIGKKQNSGYCASPQMKKQIYSSPISRPLSTNCNTSPYEDIRSLSSQHVVAENSVFPDICLTPFPSLDLYFVKWLNAAYRRHTSPYSIISDRISSMI
ncbi:unnamed protein product [Trichobilharzia szidati]|nr:unnamed protein product [Trichobilharzia szidati]